MIAWFLVPYKRQDRHGTPWRNPAIMDYGLMIHEDGGKWCATEILGDRAIVKVRATPATITILDAAPGFVRLPKDALTAPLSDLTTNQLLTLRDLVESLGYTRAEWQAKLGTDLSLVTLGDVLRFLATRRKKPRYDELTDTIVLDGEDQPCTPIEHLEGAVVA